MRLRNILVYNEALMIRDAIKDHLRTELNDINVRDTATLDEAIQLIEKEDFDVIVFTSDLLNEENKIFFQRLKASQYNESTPIIVMDFTPTDDKNSYLQEMGVVYFTISLSKTEQLKSLINSICNPRAWRRNERISINEVKIAIETNNETIVADVINFSRSGILSEFYIDSSKPDFHQTFFVHLQFPEKYDDMRIESIKCKLVQLHVISWKNESSPHQVRVSMEIVELKADHEALFDHIFEIYFKDK